MLHDILIDRLRSEPVTVREELLKMLREAARSRFIPWIDPAQLVARKNPQVSRVPMRGVRQHQVALQELIQAIGRGYATRQLLLEAVR